MLMKANGKCSDSVGWEAWLAGSRYFDGGKIVYEAFAEKDNPDAKQRREQNTDISLSKPQVERGRWVFLGGILKWATVFGLNDTYTLWDNWGTILRRVLILRLGIYCPTEDKSG